jgi:hypothetical protein
MNGDRSRRARLTPKHGLAVALGARLSASVRNRAWAMNDDALPKSE